MPESIWDLIGRLSYIISILGIGDPEGPKNEIEQIRARFEKVLGPNALFAVHRHCDTGGRDWPDAVCLGVFTSRHAAARYLWTNAVGITAEDFQHLSDGVTNELRVGDTDDEASIDVTTYTILPVMHGVDPK